MLELEDRVRRWVDDATGGVEPVSVDEARHRARRRAGLSPRLLAVAAAVVVLAVTAGVVVAFVGDDDATEVVIGDEPVEDPARLVPPDAAGVVQVFDFADARARTGTPLPGPEASSAELAAYADRLAHAGADPLGVFGLPPAERAAPEDLERELGISVRDLDQAIVFGHPPEITTVLVGRFDLDRIDRAVRTDPVWSDRLEQRSYRDVTFYSWGPDLHLDVERRTPIRPLGFATRLAVLDNVAVWVRADQDLRRMIDHLLDAATS